MQTFYYYLADLVLFAHALIVLFVIGAVPLVWLGRAFSWSFVRNFYFRLGHLLLVAFITGETLLGAICPLTTWENDLRVMAGVGPRYAAGCITYWLQHLIFFNFSRAVFIAIYVIFFALVILTYLKVRPRRPSWRTTVTHHPANAG